MVTIVKASDIVDVAFAYHHSYHKNLLIPPLGKVANCLVINGATNIVLSEASKQAVEKLEAEVITILSSQTTRYPM